MAKDRSERILLGNFDKIEGIFLLTLNSLCHVCGLSYGLDSFSPKSDVHSNLDSNTYYFLISHYSSAFHVTYSISNQIRLNQFFILVHPSLCGHSTYKLEAFCCSHQHDTAYSLQRISSTVFQVLNELECDWQKSHLLMADKCEWFCMYHIFGLLYRSYIRKELSS